MRDAVDVAVRRGLWSRRQVLAGGILVLPVSKAMSQNAEQYSALRPQLKGAVDLRASAIGMPLNAVSDNLERFVSDEYTQRRRTVEISAGIAGLQSPEGALGYVRTVPILVAGYTQIPNMELQLASQTDAIYLLAKEGDPIVPPVESVKRSQVPDIPDRPKKPESDLIVVVDILLETLGIAVGTRDLSVALIESDPRIKDMVERVVAEVSTQDWEKVASTLEALLRLIITAEIWRRVAILVGGRIAINLSLRCVPVVGWLYTTAIFLISVKKNYRRFSFA